MTEPLHSSAAAVIAGGLSAGAGVALAASTSTLLYLFIVGALIGLGQALAAEPPLSWRQIVGKALVTAGISLIAGLTYTLSPDANLLVVVASGALLSVIGVNPIREAFRARFNVRVEHREREP